MSAAVASTSPRGQTVPLWRIAVDAADYGADDVSGKGAEITGGRWNRRGYPMLYTSTNVALACLETIVHLNQGALPFNRYLVRLDVPEDVWLARETLPPSALPVGWDALPESQTSLDVGQAWLARASSALLLVPSVIAPEEFNALVNPRHPDASSIQARKTRKWLYDPRLHRPLV